MIQIVYIRLLVKSISVKEEMRLQEKDLYVKLANIHDESLKSFLYFKIMQGIEQNVPIDLQVQFVNAEDFFCMGQIDLIRILGILMDNAVEEAKSCEGKVVISMKENGQEYLFSVGNTVRQETREKGVIAGTTDKGLGRGNGLFIVDKLIGKYKNVLLNSFFREDEFVQCLRIEK